MKTGGYAFPQPVVLDGDGNPERRDGGATLRDHFAAHALAGILANPAFYGPVLQGSPAAAVDLAFLCADGAMADRAKPAKE